jgi:hypothetical protein
VREALENLDCGLLKRDPHGLKRLWFFQSADKIVREQTLDPLNPLKIINSFGDDP